MTTATTETTVRLGDLATTHIWFTSVGQPAGCDLQAEDGEELCLPGDSMPGDASDWWDLVGVVAGRSWQWDGKGRALDFGGNTVTQIVAYLPD